MSRRLSNPSDGGARRGAVDRLPGRRRRDARARRQPALRSSAVSRLRRAPPLGRHLAARRAAAGGASGPRAEVTIRKSIQEDEKGNYHGNECHHRGRRDLHIAERSDALMPSDPQHRARVTAWMFAALNSIEPRIQGLAEIDLFYASEE